MTTDPYAAAQLEALRQRTNDLEFAVARLTQRIDVLEQELAELRSAAKPPRGGKPMRSG